jgi:uncharacterized protein (DUF305 family)
VAIDGVEAEAPRSGHGPARWQVIVLVGALCFLAAVVGYWVGQPDEHETFSDVDVGFLADMTRHHNSAISMSLDFVNRGSDPVVGHFANDILLTQAQEIAVMNTLRDEAGDRPGVSDGIAMDWMGVPVAPSDMPGIPTEAEARELAGASGAEADDRFTTLMIRHHAAGAAMADHAAEHGSSARVRRLAAAMASVQRTEINEMNARRRALGLAPVDVAAVEAELAEGHAS